MLSEFMIIPGEDVDTFMMSAFDFARNGENTMIASLLDDVIEAKLPCLNLSDQPLPLCTVPLSHNLYF